MTLQLKGVAFTTSSGNLSVGRIISFSIHIEKMEDPGYESLSHLKVCEITSLTNCLGFVSQLSSCLNPEDKLPRFFTIVIKLTPEPLHLPPFPNGLDIKIPLVNLHGLSPTSVC